MLKSSHHPYQTTLPQTNYPVRNPWIEKIDSSTNSSGGSRSGHTAKSTVHQQTAEWILPESQPLSHMGPLLNQQIHPVVQTPYPGSAALSVTHGSSGGASVSGRIGSCGGQCVACETFCYYCLQVIFIAGILTGIALTIAGSVLHENEREGDLVVLLYIGVLLVLVCVLLLSVHCCVRHNVKERKKALRLILLEGARRNTSSEFTTVPVPDFAVNPTSRHCYIETELNDLDLRENLKPLVMPNTSQYQNRCVSNPACTIGVHSCERYPQRPNKQHYTWGRSAKTNSSRILQ